MPTARTRGSVVVLYNSVSDEGYDALKQVDPATLGFEPHYDIAVATVAEEYEAIIDGLRKERFQVRGVNLAEDIANLERLVRRNRPDVVFNLVESFHDSADLEPAVAGFLDLYRIPYTGATPMALAICRRKGLLKQLLLASGVPTPRFHQLWKPKIAVRHGLHYPLIVKPAREDASVGVDHRSVVYDRAAAPGPAGAGLRRIRPARSWSRSSSRGGSSTSPSSATTRRRCCPRWSTIFPTCRPTSPPSSATPRSGIRSPRCSTAWWRTARRTSRSGWPGGSRRSSLRAYRVSGCRDYARLDLRVSTDNHVYVLEANPNPDLTEGVSFMHSAEEAGYSFSRTLRRIVEMAQGRGV